MSKSGPGRRYTRMLALCVILMWNVRFVSKSFPTSYIPSVVCDFRVSSLKKYYYVLQIDNGDRNSYSIRFCTQNFRWEQKNHLHAQIIRNTISTIHFEYVISDDSEYIMSYLYEYMFVCA